MVISEETRETIGESMKNNSSEVNKIDSNDSFDFSLLEKDDYALPYAEKTVLDIDTIDEYLEDELHVDDYVVVSGGDEVGEEYKAEKVETLEFVVQEKSEFVVVESVGVSEGSCDGVCDDEDDILKVELRPCFCEELDRVLDGGLHGFKDIGVDENGEHVDECESESESLSGSSSNDNDHDDDDDDDDEEEEEEEDYDDDDDLEEEEEEDYDDDDLEEEEEDYDDDDLEEEEEDYDDDDDDLEEDEEDYDDDDLEEEKDDFDYDDDDDVEDERATFRYEYDNFEYDSDDDDDDDYDEEVEEQENEEDFNDDNEEGEEQYCDKVVEWAETRRIKEGEMSKKIIVLGNGEGTIKSENEIKVIHGNAQKNDDESESESESESETDTESESETETESESDSYSESNGIDNIDSDEEGDFDQDEEVAESKIRDGGISPSNSVELIVLSDDDEDDFDQAEEVVESKIRDGGISASKSVELVFITDDEEEDVGGNAEKVPIQSKDEIQVTSPVVLESHHTLWPVGFVISIVGTQIIVEGVGRHSSLDVGSTLWITERRIPLGIVDETFGPVKSPYYVVRFKSQAEVPDGIQHGTLVSFAPEFDIKKGADQIQTHDISTEALYSLPRVDQVQGVSHESYSDSLSLSLNGFSSISRDSGNRADDYNAWSSETPCRRDPNVGPWSGAQMQNVPYQQIANPEQVYSPDLWSYQQQRAYGAATNMNTNRIPVLGFDFTSYCNNQEENGNPVFAFSTAAKRQ